MARIPLHMYHNMEDARSEPIKRDGSIYLKRFMSRYHRRHDDGTFPGVSSLLNIYVVSPLFPSLSWHSLELPGYTLPPYRDNCVLNGSSLLRSFQFLFLVQDIFFRSLAWSMLWLQKRVI